MATTYYWNYSLTVVNNLSTQNLIVENTLNQTAATQVAAPTVGSYVTPNLSPPANWVFGADYDAGINFYALLQAPGSSTPMEIQCTIGPSGPATCTAYFVPSGYQVWMPPGGPTVLDGTNASITVNIMKASS